MSLSCLKRKIPKAFYFRDYNDPQNSSKLDVLYYNLPKKSNRSIKPHSFSRRLSKFSTLKMTESQSQKVFRESIYNPNSIFEKEEEENEPDNTTTATFYSHKKQFVYIKDSCYIFKKNSKVRSFCLYVTEAPLFKFLIIVMIISQAILFGFYDYMDYNSTSTMNKLIDHIEPVFLATYGLECGMKIITKGLYSEPNTYLRKIINFIDLWVVISGIFSYKNFFKHFGILRLFRVLILLGKLPHFKSLKMLGTILKNSIWHLITILFFLWIFLTLFAIAGLNLYKGKLNYRCRTTPNPINGSWPVNSSETRICGGIFSCAANETCGSNFDYTVSASNFVSGDLYNDSLIPQLNFGVTNFDNLLLSLVPTCQIYMVEGFHEIMYILYDATNTVIPTVFCLFLIVICGFSMSNMVVAIMVDNFSKECEKSRNTSILKDTTRDLGNVSSIGKDSSPNGLLGSINKKFHNLFKKPTFKKSDFKQTGQYFALLIAKNPIFQLAMNLLVVVNLLILALDQYPSPSQSQLQVFYYLNLAFTILFLLESFLKIKGYGVEKYKKDKFNIMELIIAIATTIEIIVGSDSSKLSSLRALRLLRMFGSHHSWDGFQILIDALVESSNYVIGFVIIFGIYIYVFAIIGKKLFNVSDPMSKTHIIDDSDSGLRGNFENTLWAYTTVFQVICLEKWNELWYKYNKLVGPTITNFYFILIIASGRFILFNLFLAALLGLFEQARINIQLKKMKALFILRTFRSEKFSPHQKKNSIIDNEGQTLKALEFRKSFKRTSTISVEKPNLMKNKVHNLMRRTTMKKNLEWSSNSKGIVHSDPGDENQESEIEKGKYEMTSNNDAMHTEENIDPPPLDIPEESFRESENQSRRASLKPRKNAIVPLPLPGSHPTEKTEEKLTTEDALISGSSVARKIFNKVRIEPILTESNNVSNRNSKNSQPRKSKALTFKPGFTIKAEKTFREPEPIIGILKYLQESSCFLFHQDSKIRKKISALISNEHWESFIIILILANSIVLALDNPLSNPDSVLNKILDTLDYIFTSVFTLEMTLKIISLGFFFNSLDNKRAYIRNVWNQLDFVVVQASILSWAVASNSSLRSLKSLRALRALRSLRMIAKNESLRIVVNAMFQTFPSIGNLAVVAFIFNLMVSINTMNAWKGTFYYCSLPNGTYKDYLKIITKSDCLNAGGSWINKKRNFDNILSASLSFFLIMVNEDWLPIMYSSIDSVGIDMQPIINTNSSSVFLYYLMIIIGNIIIMNLFVSVVIDNFKQMKEELGGYLLLSKDQRDWVEMQKFMQHKKLKIKIPVPTNKWRFLCYRLINQLMFEIFLMICILVDVVFMACRYLGMSPQVDVFIATVNDIFLAAFNIEMVIKILAQGIYFFKDNWNKMDFIAVVSSNIVVIFLLLTQNEITTLPIIIRSMRLFRIVNILKFSKTFQVIINTYYNILPSLGNIGALIFLILYIYSILGMNLFAGVWINPYKGGISPQWIPDFTQFPGSLLTMIQCAMLQKWDHYMFELAETKEGCSDSQSYKDIQTSGIKGCGTYWSYVYFMSFVVIVPMMIMNLFLAVVVEGYLESLKEQEAVINPNQMEELLDKWAEYDPTGSGFMVPENMAFLLYELHPPIGLKDDSVQFEYDILSKKNKGYLVSPNKKVILTKTQIFNLMKIFNLRLYNDHRLHFKDLCVKISRNVIMGSFGRNIDLKSANIKYEPLEIKSDYVVKTLNKGWESVYPDLKKQRLEAMKNNRYDLRASDLFAIHSIMTLLKRAKAEKKNRPVANDLDYRVYNEYQQTNIMDKNLSNKVLRTQTAFSSVQNYKKRVSRVSSPYKSRQTMISSEKLSSQIETIVKKQPPVQTSRFLEKGQTHLPITPSPAPELRKTSTYDMKSPFLDMKIEEKKSRLIGKNSLHLNPKLLMNNRLGDDKPRLKSVAEIEDDDKLFWFSYDENFRQYPTKVREDVQTLRSVIPKSVENICEESKHDENSEKEESKSKSSVTEDVDNDSEKINPEENNKSTSKIDIGGKKGAALGIQMPSQIKNPQAMQEPMKVKIMPLKLLKAQRSNKHG